MKKFLKTFLIINLLPFLMIPIVVLAGAGGTSGSSSLSTSTSFGDISLIPGNGVDITGEYHDNTLNNRVPLLLYSAKSKVVTSAFGNRFDPLTGEESKHRGTDFGCGPSEPIRTSAKGTVVEIKTGCISGDIHCGDDWGNYVKVMHSNGVHTQYAHLMSVSVSMGQTITQSQTLGICGDTGWSDGLHVHHELYLDGRRVDILPYLIYTDKNTQTSPMD